MVALVVDLQQPPSLFAMFDVVEFDSMVASIGVGMSIALQWIAVEQLQPIDFEFVAYLVVKYAA